MTSISPKPHLPRLKTICAMLMAALPASPLLAADYTRVFETPGWEGGAMDVNGDGAADFCQSVSFADESRYILIILYEKGVLFGLTDPTWTMVEDKAYPVSVTVDAQTTQTTGFANDNESLLLALPYDDPLLDVLTNGSELLVKGDMGSYAQSLTGLTKAYETLETCYNADVAGLAPIPQPEKLLQARMRNTSRDPDTTSACGAGLVEEMTFSFPEHGGAVSGFSYRFSLNVQGFDTDDCLSVQSTGELETGQITGNRLVLNVVETTSDGDQSRVTYKGIRRPDGTLILYDTTAPYEELSFTVEAPQ